MAEKLEYKQLFAGEVHGMTRVPVADGTYKRGQVIELVVTDSGTVAESSATISTTVAERYAKPTSADLGIKNDYVICDEDVVATGSTGTVAAFKYGYFNNELVTIDEAGATNVTAKGINVLRTKGIFLENVSKA